MNSSVFMGLVNNAALLLALGLLYDYFLRHLPRKQPPVLQKIVTGILLGLIGTAIMMTPLPFGNGVVFDTRSVLLCISGFFFGTIPTLIAVSMTAAVRLYNGGTGAWTGVAVIVSSGAIGIVWRRLRTRIPNVNTDAGIGELYLLGVVVHAAMLAWMLTLPWKVALAVLSGISLPVMLIYPVATALLGQLMARKEQREKQTQALRKSEERFRAMVENAPDPIFIQTNMRFAYVNPKAVALFKAESSEQLIGQPVLERVHPDFQEIAKSRIKRLNQDRKPVENSFEQQFLQMDGTPVWVETTGQPIVYDGHAGALVFVRDITLHKQAEAEKERLQSQLIQAQKMESVGRLAGGVAHDFNNMLNVILGNAELAMAKTGPDDPLQNELAEIHEAADRSAEITRQLLAFASKQTIAPQTLDLNEMIEKMLKMLHRLIGENIHLAWHPSENIWPVWMDPSQLDQILANLCVNARDAISDVGKITIETGTKIFDEAYCAENAGFIPGRFSMLAVSDNGCGMDRNTLSNLFEPFFTTKRPGKGTGLGLATVYGIVKQNKGFIKVYSEPGSGTTFRIYLSAHSEAAEPVPLKNTVHAPAGNGETVLIVEDEQAISTLIVKILDQLGYRVLEAGTPGRAMELADAHTGSIHLLITDVVMPEMNGRDLADQLIARHPGIKILFMSGYTANVIAHHGVLDKEIHFLQKPFSKLELAVKIRETLES